MKKSILAVAAIAASCASAGIYTHTTYTGSDTNLKTLAVVTDGKSYRVERKADGGDWTVVAQGLTEQQYVDRPERPTRAGYIYRVASVDGNGGLAYTISITPTGTPAAPGLAITIR